MEIYKLTDNIPVKNDGGRRIGSEVGRKITDIKQAARNENRVNIFVNGKYSFSLDIAQLLELKIKIGDEVTEAELESYQKESEFGKLYQRALEWVLTRPRSVKETKDYLRRKIFEKKLNEDFVEKIIERLLTKKYLDDKKYAEYYVENRFINKGISRRRLEMELMKNGVDKSIISETLKGADRTDEEEILKIIAKKRSKYDDEKMISYLCRQGFSFELARNLVRSYETD